MGEEPYYLEKISEALEATVVDPADRDFNLSVLYGADSTVEQVVGSARQFPMMGGERLVILKEAQSMMNAKKSLDKLLPYYQNPSQTTVLVVVFKGDSLSSTSKAMKAAAAAGAVVFNSPKLKDWQMPEVIRDFCQSRNISIDDKVISLLMDYVGLDVNKMFGEIDKMIVASGGKAKRITAELVEENIGISKEFNNWELCKAVMFRDYFRSMRIIEYFRRYKTPTPLTSAALFSQFSQLVIANLLRDKSEMSLMQALRLKNKFALPDIRTGLSNFNGRQSLAAITAIREFDCKSKGIGSVANEYQLLKELIFKLLTL